MATLNGGAKKMSKVRFYWLKRVWKFLCWVMDSIGHILTLLKWIGIASTAILGWHDYYNSHKRIEAETKLNKSQRQIDSLTSECINNRTYPFKIISK